MTVVGGVFTGCRSPQSYRAEADDAATAIIEQKQQEALGRTEPFTVLRPEVALREKLVREQGLQVSSPMSVGVQELERPDNWVDDDYLTSARSDQPLGVQLVDGTVEGLVALTLEEALAVAALNSREFQDAKERVFLTALDLDLARDDFRITAEGGVSSTATADLATEPEETLGVDGSASLGFSRRFRNGVEVAGAIGADLARLFTLSESSSLSLFGDASISIPLLRGSGDFIVTEPLTQAERDAVYAIWEFERFKRSFAVRVASSYLNVLSTLDQVNNSEQNYRSLIAASRQLRRLADFGRRPEIEVDQAVQDELQARAGWIRAQQNYESSLDGFLTVLGLPPDANVELTRGELGRLGEAVREVLDIPDPAETLAERAARPPVDADSPIELAKPTRESGGPLELEETRAVGIALTNRLDLRSELGRVWDAQRSVIVAADALRAELTLLGSAAFGERRSLAGADQPDSRSLRPDLARYEALLTLDLPFERTAERNAYRASFVNLERSVRGVQALEDSIKAGIRTQLRTLLESREGLQIQATAVALAERRVESTRIFLDEGRAATRDLLEAQEALLSAQNALTQALVDYRIAELELQRDMGVLEVDELAQWDEFDPEAYEAVEPMILPRVFEETQETGPPAESTPGVVGSSNNHNSCEVHRTERAV